MSIWANQAEVDAAIAIVGASAVTLAEGPAKVLLSAIMCGASGARLHSDMRYPSPMDPQTSSPAIIAPMDGMSEILSERIVEIMDRTLEGLGDLLDTVDSATLGIMLMLPAGRYGLHIDKEIIGDILWSYFPDLKPVSLELVPENESATSVLKRLCAKLLDGEIQSALFCGVDSYIDSQVYDELAAHGGLAIQSDARGVIPGEGGGAVLLKPVKHLQADDPDNVEPLAIIGNLAVMPEPHTGAAEEKPMKGLADAVRAVLGGRDDLLENTPCLLYSLQAGIAGDLEWYQVKKSLWPQRLDESQRVAMMLDEEEAPQLDGEVTRQEYNLAQCLGETGVATLPILLTAACEKFRYDRVHERFGFPADSHLLVCELRDRPWRGALWLTHNVPSTVN